MRFRCLFLASLLISNSISAATVTVTGDVVDNYKYLEFQVIVDQIKKASLAKGGDTPEEELLKGYLHIYLTDSDAENPIIIGVPKAGATVGDSTNENFFYEGTYATVDPSTNDNFKATFRGRIYPNHTLESPPTFDALKQSATDGGTFVNVVAEFMKSKDGSTFESVTKSAITPLNELHSEPAEAPASVVTNSAYKGIRVVWDSKATVTYTNPDVTRTPSSVLIMAFPSSVTTATLDAMVVDDTAGNDSETTCTYTSGNTDCIACDNEKAYVKATQTDTDLNFITADNNGSNLISGLTVGEPYTFVMQYLKGTVRTECVVVTPELDLTLSELNGAQEGEMGDPRCFIVSASYGGSGQWQVEMFRTFRDRVLLSFDLGKRFVDWYYDVSPPFANVIREHPILQAAARAILWPFSFALSYWVLVGDWMTLVTLFLCVCAGAFYLRRKSFFSVS